jgi:hypothetical protein
MADVELEIIDLVTGTSLGTYPLTICTPITYELDIGNYRFIATYLKTGQALQTDIDIVQGANTPLDFVFNPVTHTLTIDTTTGGTTSPSPSTYTYAEGTVVTVQANSAMGYYFDHWELDGINVGSTNPIKITMDADHTLTAYFSSTPIPTFQLTISTTTGGNTSPSPGAYTYNEGTSVPVTANPTSGYAFDHWSLDGATRTENPINIVMDRDYTLTAYFEAIPPVEYTLTIGTTVGGTTDPAPGSYAYPEGTSVQVRAIPDSGFNFDHWILDGVQYTSNPITVLMNQNHTITAYFSETPPPPPTTYKLNLNSTVGGTTDPAPSIYEYDAGSTVTVTAIPDVGYKFNHWELDGVVKSANPLSILMDKDHTLLAVFAEIPPPTKCFIATATYGSPLAPQLHILRKFRDHYLPDFIVETYYRVSPPIARYIQRRVRVRMFVRCCLEPVVKILRKIL